MCTLHEGPTLYHCRRLISNLLFSLWMWSRSHSIGKHGFLQKNDDPATNQVMFGANHSCFVRPVDFGTAPLAHSWPNLSIHLKFACHWHTSPPYACKSGQWMWWKEAYNAKQAVRAGEIISQYKLEAFCADLRRGALRPPGGFGRIRAVEFFSRENPTTTPQSTFAGQAYWSKIGR